MEADTVMFSIYAALRNSDYRQPVVVDAADTDIYVAAAHTSHMYPGDLLIKRKNDFVNSSFFLKRLHDRVHYTYALHDWM